MAKVCRYQGCDRPVFGGGYCMAHQWARPDKKPKKLAKRAIKRGVKGPDFGFDSQLQVFKHVFFKLDKPVICPITGRDITDIMKGPVTQWIKSFAHILPKGKYSHWRLNPRNIRMIHPEAHHIIDQGTKEDRKNHPDWNWCWWDDQVTMAKIDYKKFIKDNLL